MRRRRGIITLSDQNYFPGLLMLHRSVQESFPCLVACYDLGLTKTQQALARELPNLKIMPMPRDPRIRQIQRVMSAGAPLSKPNKRVWPLWICPLLIKHAPFDEIVWMDCDLAALRNLSELFDQLEEGPVFTPENKAPEKTPNHPDLYRLLPIDRLFDPLLPTVNAGVSAWRKERDAAAIDAYIYPILEAVADRAVREAISWHDQGALIWAIQSCGLEHRVVTTFKWNLCVDNSGIADRQIPWNSRFLETVRAAVPDANILHWNGRKPPWLIDGKIHTHLPITDQADS